mgnify:CR=1 FL=1
MKKGATIRNERKSDKCIKCGKEFQDNEELTFDNWGRCSHKECLGELQKKSMESRKNKKVELPDKNSI